MAAAPELEPVAELTLKRLILPLGTLLVFSVTYGLSRAAQQVARAFFGTLDGAVGWIPWVGDVLTAPINRVAQKINSVLSKAAMGSERQIGDALHQFAALIHALGSAIHNAPLLAYALAKYVTTLLSIQQWHKFYNSLVGTDRATLGRIKAQERTTHAQVKAVAQTAKVATHAQTRAAAIPGEVAHDWNIPALRARTRANEDSLTRLWRWAKAHAVEVTTDAAVATVALALPRLGADWIRCRTAKDIFGRRGCSFFSDLEKLLGIVGEALLLTNICAVIPWVEEAFSVVAAPLIAALTTVGAGLCGKDSAPPELLPVATLYLPAQTDATLYLP